MSINIEKDNDNKENENQNFTRSVDMELVDEEHDLTNNEKMVKKSKLKYLIEKSFFQKLLFLSFYRVIIYINKIYQDINTTDQYWNKKDFYYFLISIISLVAPPIAYSVYLVGSKLIKQDVSNIKLLGTDVFQGLLLFCWQIKRHLDFLFFSTQHVCSFRPATKEEKNNIIVMKRNANILEFFENFYAGFLQILLQSYIWLGTVDLSLNPKLNTKPFLSQLLASTLCVVSFMVMCKRKDDGLLTGFLSFSGWFLLMTSRVLVFSLIAFHIHYWLFLFILVHVILFSIWIFNIAIESYTVSSCSDETPKLEFNSFRKRCSLILMVFLFFGIPSIIFWPIMFNLKEKKRPLIYLVIIILENLFLLALWSYFQYQLSRKIASVHVQIVCLIVFCTLVGVFFISLFVLCKPKYADQVVLYELREGNTTKMSRIVRFSDVLNKSNNSLQYGIYYEFCDIVFKLPSISKIKTELEEIELLQLVA